MKDFLIVTLSTGEPQHDDCVESVKRQKKVTFEHRVISGLNAFDSAVELHSIAFSERKKFKYLLKLDADMTLSSDFFLWNLMSLFEQAENLNRITLSVRDAIIDEVILGIHAIKMSAINSMQKITEQRRDNWLSEIRGRNYWTLNKSLLVFHCKNPSEKQKYIFGFNRGLKLKIQGKMSPNYETLYLAVKKRNTAVLRGFLDASYEELGAKFDNESITRSYEKKHQHLIPKSFDYYYFNKFGLINLVKIKIKIYLSLISKWMQLCF